MQKFPANVKPTGRKKGSNSARLRMRRLNHMPEKCDSAMHEKLLVNAIE
jgi:hypothetical protein